MEQFNDLPRELKGEILSHCLTLVPQILCLNRHIYSLLIDKIVSYYKNAPPLPREVVKYLKQVPNQFYLLAQSKRLSLDHFSHNGYEYKVFSRCTGECHQTSPVDRKYDTYDSSMLDANIQDSIIKIYTEGPDYEINLREANVDYDLWTQYQIYKKRVNLLDVNDIKTRLLRQLDERYQTCDLNDARDVLSLYLYLYTNIFIIFYAPRKIKLFQNTTKKYTKITPMEWDENGKLLDRYLPLINKYKLNFPTLYRNLQSKINSFE